MKAAVSWGLIIGTSVGVLLGLVLAIIALCCLVYNRKKRQFAIQEIGIEIDSNSSSRRSSALRPLPIRTSNGSDADAPPDSSKSELQIESSATKNVLSGISKYSYKELQKATSNFTTVIGEGAFGAVYKADMPARGETVAVKVLSRNSKQGEKEFKTEVLLLGRLHHRNLVNLVGYCDEKGNNMLIYDYMSNGSLASHLYRHRPQQQSEEALSWDLRIYIALDVARAIEYLHDGAVPAVIHLDIKSSNVLLDGSMRARVADFGLSMEEKPNYNSTPSHRVKGTFGYLDPEYISSKIFTKKSDVYSFGILLFELITARNPQQGLMEYVQMATLNCDGRVGWEDIVDPRMEGDYDLNEINVMATLAYRCVSRLPRKRPSMRIAVQTLSNALKGPRHKGRQHRDSLSVSLVDADAWSLDQRRENSNSNSNGSLSIGNATNTNISFHS